jgi:hypothetical protein
MNEQERPSSSTGATTMLGDSPIVLGLKRCNRGSAVAGRETDHERTETAASE